MHVCVWGVWGGLGEVWGARGSGGVCSPLLPCPAHCVTVCRWGLGTGVPGPALLVLESSGEEKGKQEKEGCQNKPELKGPADNPIFELREALTACRPCCRHWPSNHLTLMFCKNQGKKGSGPSCIPVSGLSPRGDS